MNRYWKVLAWTVICVLLLTAAQFGSVHLLTARPSSWLFEASLDLGPPLLFFGDLMQLHFDNGSQAPLRDQPGPRTSSCTRPSLWSSHGSSFRHLDPTPMLKRINEMTSRK